ncbi:Coenzyme A biosynthesis bifunctional protein CoaBC [Lacunisphaera limnophila]|uniref:Coenzyme A biosynthesis bifunctional protein CoaBC n=1 Tax=Lacunisphaera limnophila TaxID=1838286 RepID=A0A1D8AV49_9BACT|nr:bifunctional phosphopantothenoylcysteine decarboxylase/phosphopantothenate--cysteine ligase CoaBC [Lacunisphaera limnophila]AOS44778.1 Coenzyme A biosynthesis bifunctional protein CoaBC [Lacunisphaera limnophila]
MSPSNLLVIFTGSIAAYKGCEVVSRLVQCGHRVRCVATASALKFIGPATLEGLTGAPVLSDAFAPGVALEHIALTRWADAVLVCPATANTLNRFAAGLADDLAGALFLAHDRAKPWLVAPAMNPAMWAHPATVAGVARLRGWGVRFIDPEAGRTACGENGEGRLAEPETIVAAVEGALAKPARKLRVLVTAGGTVEPVDGVRVLTNTSTGATGAMIATQLARAGHEVVLLRAQGAVAADGPCREETFVTFTQLQTWLHRLLAAEAFDAVIHAAAVSDYGVDMVVMAEGSAPVAAAAGGKLASGGAPVLKLRSNPRLVDGLRGLSRAPFTLVAFKLTHGAECSQVSEAVRRLFAHSGADYVVHNDLAARGADGRFPADILRPDGTVAVHCPDRGALAAELVRLLEDGPIPPPLS